MRSYCSVINSSESSRPSLRIPLFNITWTRQRAWIVRPKCRPWWTNGSVRQLIYVNKSRVHEEKEIWNLTLSFLAQARGHSRVADDGLNKTLKVGDYSRQRERAWLGRLRGSEVDSEWEVAGQWQRTSTRGVVGNGTIQRTIYEQGKGCGRIANECQSSIQVSEWYHSVHLLQLLRWRRQENDKACHSNVVRFQRVSMIILDKGIHHGNIRRVANLRESTTYRCIHEFGKRRSVERCSVRQFTANNRLITVLINSIIAMIVG